MNIEAMTKWIEALEDPANEKRQIREDYNDGEGGVCALGLGWETQGVSDNLAFMVALGDTSSSRASSNPLYVRANGGYFGVADLNDAGWSFWDIAQALRATHLKEST